MPQKVKRKERHFRQLLKLNEALDNMCKACDSLNIKLDLSIEYFNSLLSDNK